MQFRTSAVSGWPISSKRRAPSPRITGTLTTGYQTTLPKPRRPVKAGLISSQSEWRCGVLRRSHGDETARGGGDGTGVGDVELNRCAGGERLGESHDGFVQLAGVVGVGVDGGERVRYVAASDANAFPVEGRGDLQRNARQRRGACVAHGDKSACGELLCGGIEADIEIEAR